MSDETIHPMPAAEAAYGTHEDRLAAILDDPTLPDRDKRQAIQEALEELQRERGESPAAAYEPVEQRFFEALGLLADGGHDYDGANVGRSSGRAEDGI